MERAYANRPDTVAPQQSKGATKPVKMVDALGNPSVSKPLSTLTGSSKPLSPSMGSSKPLPSFLPGKPKSTVSPRTEGMEKEKVATDKAKNMEGDPPIPMEGQRFFNHPSAEIEEIKKLPTKPTHGQVVTFEYTNEDGATVLATYTYMNVTHTYNAPNETGRWEKGVTNSMHGSGYKEGEYVTLAEVEAIKEANRDLAEARN